MLVAGVCVLLLVLTTVIHYEMLRALAVGLPIVRMPARAKLLVVIFGAFLAHAAEILLYAVGYGDVVPSGELRLLAGVEALNGLLLIGWSASYTFIAMERFWKDGAR